MGHLAPESYCLAPSIINSTTEILELQLVYLSLYNLTFCSSWSKLFIMIHLTTFNRDKGCGILLHGIINLVLKECHWDCKVLYWAAVIDLIVLIFFWEQIKKTFCSISFFTIFQNSLMYFVSYILLTLRRAHAS